jgi:hypothetical protein
MRLYDTARAGGRALRAGPVVTMYTCGITPYDATHFGHAATYLTYDVLQRRLRDRGHETRCVRNITDVDDDLLRKARELGVHYLDLAAGEIARFDDDMEALGPAAELERAARHLRHRRHPRLHRHGARPRPRLRVRRLRCTSTSPQLGPGSARSATTTATRCSPRRRARRQPRRPQQAQIRWTSCCGSRRRPTSPAGSRCGARAGRAGTSSARRWPARAGHHHRPARRRQRPDLPAPRVRVGAVRGRHRRAVRAPLDAPGHGPHGRREDVEVAGQPGVRERAAQGVGPPGDPAGHRGHHYRIPWEWHDEVMPDAARRLAAWAAAGEGEAALDEVRAALDDDLDTPGAVAAIDAAAAAGHGRRPPPPCSACRSDHLARSVDHLARSVAGSGRCVMLFQRRSRSAARATCPDGA